MGPRTQGYNRSTRKVAHREANKAKHSKSLKNKLRDVQRLLKQPDLPATVRVVQERMLDVLKHTIKDKAKEEKEKRIMKRSKKLKFFEKRKLFRKYKTCVRELTECNEDETRNALQKELEEIKVHWNYVIHFPQDTKYISLFPLTSFSNEEVHQKREQILKVISEKVASCELEDASTTIGQMSSGLKERKTSKLRLAEGAEQAKVEEKEEKNDESEDEGPSIKKQNSDDDFFIQDSSPSTEPSTPKEECEKKKKKATNKRKRSQFKFQKN